MRTLPLSSPSPRGESAWVSVRLCLALVVCACGVLLGILSVAATSPSGDARLSPADEVRTLSKIASWVTERTADGNTAEFLVVLDAQADLSGAAVLRTKEEKGRYVRDALWKTAEETQGPVIALLRERGLEHRAYYIVNFIWVRGSIDDAMALAARPDVARIEGNPVIRNLQDPLPEEAASPLQPESITAIEPGIAYSRAPDVWATGFTGQGIVVAGADTGYRWTHAALKGKYRGWNGTTADHNYNWHDSIHSGGGTCGPNSTVPCDDQGHGTHTMGTAIGDDGAANQIGMAPGAKWIGCRNMNQGNGTPTTYLECLEFFLAPYPVGGTTAQGDSSKAPHVTANSWGCPPSEGCSANTLQTAFEVQRTAGIMTVTSAGNEGPNCSTVGDPPGIYDAVYAVGALSTGTDNIASFSSRGPVLVDGSMRRKPDISAPGTSTRSASRNSDTAYTSLSGTSMAAPHVAGAAALLLSARPGLRGDISGIRTSLNRSALPLLANTCDVGSPAASPNNTFGYGRLDAKNAIDLVLQLTAAVSRKNHNNVPYDIDLLGTPAPVECRNSAGSHTLIFAFSGNVTTGNASVASGSGSVAGAPSFAGNTMTVNLNGVGDAQKLTLNLTGVTDGTRSLPNTSVTVGMLVGDSTGDGTVNSGDAIITRNRSGQTTDATNFRSDCTLDGSINGGDATVVRARSGQSL